MSSCSKISSPVGIFPLKSSIFKLKDLIDVLLKYSQSSYQSQFIISYMSKVSLTQTQSAVVDVKFILYILSNPTSPIASRIKITLGSQHDKSFQITTSAVTWLKYCRYRVKPYTFVQSIQLTLLASNLLGRQIRILHHGGFFSSANNNAEKTISWHPTQITIGHLLYRDIFYYSFAVCFSDFDLKRLLPHTSNLWP